MKISKVWIWFSLAAGLLMAWVSWLGVSSESTYGKETLNWAAQATGQDYVSLFLTVPLLFVSAYFLYKGSLKAYLIWLGVLFYMVYSYVLYSFFVHFGPNFLFYVAILGLSFYSIAGSLMDLNMEDISRSFEKVRVRYARILLAVVGVTFFLLWLADVAKSIASGTVPASATEAGLFVNPVHVMDMAFLLPGCILVSMMLGRKKTVGYLFAVPLMTFFVVTGIAMISMFQMLEQKGFPAAPVPETIMGILVIADVLVINEFLKDMP